MKTLALIVITFAVSACSTLPRVDVFQSDAHSINNRGGAAESCDMQLVKGVLTLVPCGVDVSVFERRAFGRGATQT